MPEVVYPRPNPSTVLLPDDEDELPLEPEGSGRVVAESKSVTETLDTGNCCTVLCNVKHSQSNLLQSSRFMTQPLTAFVGRFMTQTLAACLGRPGKAQREIHSTYIVSLWRNPKHCSKLLKHNNFCLFTVQAMPMYESTCY